MPNVNIEYRFEDPNGALLHKQQHTEKIPYDTQRSHVFTPPENKGYVTPKPQKKLIIPGHVPGVRFIYREQLAAAIIIRYMNQHGKLITEQELDLPMGHKIDPTKDGKVPRGYQLEPHQEKTITAGRVPQTVTLNVDGLVRTKAVNLILDLETPSGHTVENITHKVAVKLKTGDAYHIDPLNYTPKGYHSLSSTETGYLGVDGLTKPDITFEYSAMPAAPVSVTYVNQRQRRVGSFAYSGYMHQKVNVMNPNHVPNGYHLIDDNPRVIILQPSIQAITVNVTGDQESAKITAELIYQEPTGDVTQDLTKEITVKGQVGDMFNVDPNNWVKPGYRAVSHTLNGYFLPNGSVSNTHTIFKYEAESASLISVTYVNQSGQIVSTQQLHGYVDQAVDLSHIVPVPDGYHLVEGQKVDYTCTLTPQNIKLNVQGEFQTNDFGYVAIVENGAGHQITHRDYTVPVKASVGDKYKVDPADHPINGYVPISDPLIGIVHDHHLSIQAHRFVYRPQPVHTAVDYVDARNTVIKTVPVNAYLDDTLNVSDTSKFTKEHMPDGYQYLEIPTNPRRLTLTPGMTHIRVKIAPLAPEQSHITQSPLYPSFVIDWGRWHYVKRGSKQWDQIVRGSQLSQHLVYHTIGIREFTDKMKTLLFVRGFSQVWPR